MSGWATETLTLRDCVRVRIHRRQGTRPLPPVLLVHGGPGGFDYLDDLARLVPINRSVVRLELRGTGGSGSVGITSVSRLVDDIEEIRLVLGYAAWVAIGHSFGADLVLAWALRFPASAAGVLYLCGPGLGDWAQEYEASCRRRLGDEGWERLQQLKAHGDDLTASERLERIELSLLPDFVDPASAYAFAARPRGTSSRDDVAQQKSDLSRDGVLHDLDEAFPGSLVTVARGELDPRPAANCRAVAERFRGARFVSVPGAGHYPWLERPDVITELVAGVCSRADAHAEAASR